MKTAIKILIVEDDARNAAFLTHIITKHFPSSEIIGAVDNINEAVSKINHYQPDLVFLDIILKEELVFELFDHVRDFNFQIIFTTAYEQFAVKVFKYNNVVDYLLKPIIIEDLKQAVKRAIKKHNQKEFLTRDLIKKIQNSIEEKKNYITVCSKKEVLFLDEDEIVYCQASGKYSVFNLTNGNEEVSTKNLGFYEKLLNPKKFFRIHKSYIVNLSHISRVSRVDGGFCELRNGEKLMISKKRLEELLQFFNSSPRL